jgi:exonuclease III/ribonuclease HI
MNKDRQQLHIIQYNVQKSYSVMNTFLKDQRILEYAVMCIQEPWLNTRIAKQTHNPTQGNFDVFMADGEERPLVAFFVNRKLGPQNIKVSGRGPYHATIRVKTRIEGREEEIIIHNIYNPKDTGGLQHIEGRYEGIPRDSCLPMLEGALERHQGKQQIVVGDFNIHHGRWSGMESARSTPSTQTEFMIGMMERWGLDLCLEQGTITRPPADLRSTRGSTIDLVWATEGIQNMIRRCGIQHALDSASDHLPIETVIECPLIEAPLQVRRKFKDMDVEAFSTALRRKLPRCPQHQLHHKSELDQLMVEITGAIQEAIEETIPSVAVCARSIPGFTVECREAINTVKYTQRRWKNHPNEDNLQGFQEAKQARARAIAKANREAHRDKVSEVTDEKSLWSLARWARNRSNLSAAFTPDLKDKQGILVSEVPEKMQILKEAFFPKPPKADLSDIQGYIYPPARGEPWVPITEHEVRTAIQIVPPDKAPGEDQIPNRVLKAVESLLTPILTKVFNYSIELQYCPKAFKKSITVVLRKPGKSDYTAPKSYRPVALINTLGKVMDTVLARRIQHITETLELLPPTHIGGRKNLSCEHAIHLLMEKVHTAWRRKKVASLLMLDVSGAFDNVSHARLLHNLQKRGLPIQLVYWIRSYLENRRSRIRLREGTGEEFEVRTGIPQGSPLSPILYLFYNVDLLEIGIGDTLVTGYIDDTSIMVESGSTALNNNILRVIHQKAARWAKTHASVFAPQKYELIHFIHRRDTKRFKDKMLDLTIEVEGSRQVVEAKRSARYLGVWLDSELSGKAHLEQVVQRATKSIEALAAITGSTWGITRGQTLQLYKTVVIPGMTYAASTWYILSEEYGFKTHKKRVEDTLSRLQKKALCLATGAFRTTALSVLEVDTYTLPIPLQLMQTTVNTALRIKGTPTFRRIQQSYRGRGLEMCKDRISPLQRLEIQAEHILGLAAVNQIEERVASVVPPWWTPPQTHIAATAQEGTREHDRIQRECKENPRHLILYSDGSDIGGRVGASSWCPKLRRQMWADLGPTSRATVYAAELLGILYSLITAVTAKDIKRATLFVDNQAAIQSTASPRGQSGQMILSQITHFIGVLHKRGVLVDIRWIPAHTGVPGNEKADTIAKQATGWRAKGRSGTKAPQSKWVRQLLSSCKRTIKETVYKTWAKLWKTQKTGQAYRSHFGSEIEKAKMKKIYKGLSKPAAAILVQLRTGKIGLGAYLKSINVVETATCLCEQANETVSHILGECQEWSTQRKQYLGQSSIWNVPTLLSDAKMARKAADFIRSTELLEQFIGCYR